MDQEEEHHRDLDLAAEPVQSSGAEHEYAQDYGHEAEPEVDPEAPEPKPKRNILKPLLIGLGALVGVAAIAFGALFFLKLGPFAPPPPVAVMPMPGPPRPGGPGAQLAKGPGGKPMPGIPPKPGAAAKPGAPGKPGSTRKAYSSKAGRTAEACGCEGANASRGTCKADWRADCLRDWIGEAKGPARSVYAL